MRRPVPSSPHRRGTAAVEFAVVALPLATLALGVIEVGRLLQVKTIMASAAREGARIAAQAKIINRNYTLTEIHKEHGGSTPRVYAL
jgi:Flp pilus assembly protein TadG